PEPGRRTGDGPGLSGAARRLRESPPPCGAYAATDAWVGREIFLRLKEMGVIYPELIFDD
ncbi:MAG: hypothetical protein R6W72_00625, partial [Desulfurivibrionaceae bacterium]